MDPIPEVSPGQGIVICKIMLDLKDEAYHTEYGKKLKSALCEKLTIPPASSDNRGAYITEISEEVVTHEGKDSVSHIYEVKMVCIVQAQRTKTVEAKLNSLQPMEEGEITLPGYIVTKVEVTQAETFTDIEMAKTTSGGFLGLYAKPAKPQLKRLTEDSVDSLTDEDFDRWFEILIDDCLPQGIPEKARKDMMSKPRGKKSPLLKSALHKNSASANAKIDKQMEDQEAEAKAPPAAPKAPPKQTAPPQRVYEHIRIKGAKETAENHLFMDVDERTEFGYGVPYECVGEGKEAAPDAHVLEGNFIASEWEKHHWQFAESWKSKAEDWRWEEEKKHKVKRRMWTRTIQIGDDDGETTLADQLTELSSWAGADPELVAIQRQALILGMETNAITDSTNTTLKDQRKTTQATMARLQAMNAPGGSLDFGSNRLADIEKMDKQEWMMAGANIGVSDWRVVDYDRRMNTLFEMVDMKPCFRWKDLRGPCVEFTMTEKGGWFGPKTANYYAQANSEAIYFVRLDKGRNKGALDSKMHTILEYKHIASLQVKREDQCLSFGLRDMAKQYPGAKGFEDYELKVLTGPTKEFPYRKGRTALVRAIIMAAEAFFATKGWTRAIEVHYDDGAVHFNEKPPKFTKTMLARQRAEGFAAGDDFLTAAMTLATENAALQEKVNTNITQSAAELEAVDKSITETRVKVNALSERVDKRVDHITGAKADEGSTLGDMQKNATQTVAKAAIGL